ncbi:MAG TPA: phosphomannomutase, partial [Geopsychrobacteraceae bacterium]|nr:phosphomannomutase [Geopsychrobacteraceae bacterium]
KGEFAKNATKGTVKKIDNRPDYVQHLLTYVNKENLKLLKIVVNAGNGGAGAAIDALEPFLPFEFIKIHHNPDGNFPNGIPNPLLPENRSATRDAVLSHGADLGIAWDGDFDRCFLFDGQGQFIEGYYIVGLLGEYLLTRNPGAKIIHDPRLTWNTVDVVAAAGGIPVQSKTGHAFIKERMRLEDAIYGGEMSAHHYFREFAYCDSGMIPWLMVVQLMSQSEKSLAGLVGERMRMFPASGEINRRIENPLEAIGRVEELYADKSLLIDRTDGLSMEFEDWRFNLRCSNTEPLLRLNVESRRDVSMMEQKTSELLSIIDG